MAETTQQPVLSIRQLSVDLPAGADRAHAVEQVSLTIYPGQTLCVVGESGSGKSVMATSVMGLLAKELKTSGGEIVLQGESLLEASAGRLRALRGRSMGPALLIVALIIVLVKKSDAPGREGTHFS